MTTGKSIWQTSFSAEELNGRTSETLVSHLGIVFTAVGADFIEATMPVDARTRQPFGLLHGGASVALAETLASVGGTMACAPGRVVVGLEINANHMRPVRKGTVTGRAQPLHLGDTTQVWDVRIADGAGRLVCVCRMTAAVRPAIASASPTRVAEE